MNKRIKWDKQNILLKHIIQISVSLCLKAKRIPLGHQGAVWLSTEHMAKFKMSMQCSSFSTIVASEYSL